MQTVHLLAEANAGRYLLVDGNGRPAGERGARLDDHPDVAWVAHQVQRGDVAQEVTQPAQRATHHQRGLGPQVAAPAQGGEILQAIGFQVCLVLPRDVVKFTERPQVMDVVLAVGFLRRAAVLAAEAIPLSRSLPLGFPVGPPVAGQVRYPDSFPPQSFDHLIAHT